MACMIPKNNLIEVEDDLRVAEFMYLTIRPFVSKIDPFDEMDKIRILLNKYQNNIKISHCARRMYMGMPLFAIIWDLPDIQIGETAYVEAYVYNHVIPEFSEFGSIIVKREQDGYHYIG